LLYQKKADYFAGLIKNINFAAVKQTSSAMKKLVFAAGLLVISLTACVRDNQSNQNEQLEPAEIEQPTDTLQEVTGVAIDGAMNSVYLKVGDDTIEFNYPDLDSDHRAAWSINDTLTVRYYETADGDSVTEVINGTIS
jgi:hypothetical protein